jgi:hypothetical protein
VTVTRGFLVIFLSSAVCALAGGGIGYALGVFAPGYYRGVSASGREPWFNPVEVGIGLGLCQGMIFGAIIGAVVVLAVALASRYRGEESSLLTPDFEQPLGWRDKQHPPDSDRAAITDRPRA